MSSVEDKKVNRIVIITFAVLIVFILGVVTLITVSSINSTNDRNIQENQTMENIGGDLNIVSMDSYVGSSESAKIKGCFVFFTGVYEGKTETMVRFSWQSGDGFYYLYEVPSSLFQRTVSTNDQMKVNFNLDLDRFDANRRYDLPAKVTPLDYNYIIKNFSKGVTVSMTDEQYTQFLKITYSNPVN